MRTKASERERLRAYRKTAKGKAALKRWHLSPAGQASMTAYRATEKWTMARRNQRRRRIWVGHDYYGTVPTFELAQTIQAHVKRRLSEYRTRLTRREETQGVSAGAV